MSFWKRLFKRKKYTPESDAYEPLATESAFDETEFLSEYQFSNALLREKFIYQMVERMKEAADEIDILNREYDTITSHLTDMEEMERIPEDLMGPLKDCASKILSLEAEHKTYQEKGPRMSEEDYAYGQRIEPEMPGCYEKLRDTEEYQNAIRSDLSRMEGEKQAYYYRRAELKSIQANLRGIVWIVLIAVVICMLILLIMQFGFELETYVGYILTAGVAAVSFTVLFVKNMDVRKEARVVEKTICKLIQMHNTIKIRYVNNTGLLDYLYLKYEVNSAKEMMALWENYQQEKEERNKFEKTKSDISYYRKLLLSLLKGLPIASPNVWLYQVEAIVKRNEMVEIRHGLITQRQNLRKQMEYNRNVALQAKKELEAMLKTYPQYSTEVLRYMDEFESRNI